MEKVCASGVAGMGVALLPPLGHGVREGSLSRSSRVAWGACCAVVEEVMQPRRVVDGVAKQRGESIP